MKTIKFISTYCIVFIFGSINLYAQNDSIKKDVITDPEFPEIKYDIQQQALNKELTCFTAAQKTIYPDEKRLIDYIKYYYTYTKEPEKNGMNGYVTLYLYISETGKIFQTEIANSSGDLVCNIAALQLVRSMPDWKPATKNGKNVTARHTLTFVFKLPPSENLTGIGIKAGILTSEGNFIDYEEYNNTIEGTDAYLIANGKFAEYNGGEMELKNFLAKNLCYPVASLEQNQSGQVIIEFIVSKTGQVHNINCVKSSGYELLDIEAIRVVSLMPSFNPAKIDNKPENLYFIVPVNFMFKK
jgi:TonB family protein